MFRYYENRYKGKVCANIMYSEGRAHKLYAAADVMLVPSRFEPCGLTQLMAFRYGTLPIVRETGGLKDTVQAYNEYEETGNGFSFDQYRPKSWRAMIKRALKQDFSWNSSAKQYIGLYQSMF